MDIKELNHKELSSIAGGRTSEYDVIYSLYIESYRCSKERLINLLKELMGIDSNEAQEIVDSLPGKIKDLIYEAQADYWQNKLTSNHVKVRVEITHILK